MRLSKQTTIMGWSVFLVLVVVMTSFAGSYHESPMLQELVERGTLPPVGERLPVEPLVVGPGTIISEQDLDWQIGRYGGTLRMAHNTPDWEPDIFIMAHEPLLMAEGFDLDNIRGNLVSDFTVNEDNTVFTFTLREGLKWSDGVPVTTSDVLFAYQDVMLNTELTPMVPAKFRSGGNPSGEPMTLRALDDYTFEITFTEPYGDFLAGITIKHWVGYTDLLKPKHYLKNYHINYTTLEEMQADLDQLELESGQWWNLFFHKDIVHWGLTNRRAIGFPVLRPWMIVEGPAGRLTFERNPYYFKVDIEGNQLPYIDRLVTEEVSDLEMVTMKILTGEIDFIVEDTSLSNMPLYLEHAQRAGYDVINTTFHFSPTVFQLNYTNEDEVWRNTVWDKRFRQAVNLAIDREEIIQSIYFGFASLPHWVPSEYNVAKAHALLDEMGMNQRDSDGYRLSPCGERFEVFLEFDARSPDFPPIADLINAYLQDIDIRVSMRQISMQLHGQRGAANELVANLGWIHSDTWPWLWDDYLPGSWNLAPLWRSWYDSGGTAGEEPPAWVKELYAIHERVVQSLPGSDERHIAEDDLYSWYQQNILYHILVDRAVNPMIASTRLGNVPHSGMTILANRSGEQFFFKD